MLVFIDTDYGDNEVVSTQESPGIGDIIELNGLRYAVREKSWRVVESLPDQSFDALICTVIVEKLDA